MQRLTVLEAARRLGVSPQAVRKRIKRGAIEHDQDRDGITYVYVEAGNPGSSPPGEGASNQVLERLLQNQEREVEYLRGQLSEEREARRRAEHTIAALARRIPGLEAPPFEPQSAQEAEHGADGTDADGAEASESGE